MTLLNFDTQIIKIYFNFFHISVDFKYKKGETKVWLKNHTSLYYLSEPSRLNFNLPSTTRALTLIQ